MIPKIIHYCWFGGNPLPKLAVKCIESWKKYLPEYEIKEWNESNFPIEEFRFAKEALDEKKYAYVSDVCRLYALKMYGGIYMDTDVEVIKSMDSFLHHSAFSGFENDNFVPTGLMAAEKESKWATEMLDYYNDRSFYLENGMLDTTSNTVIITELMKMKGFEMNNQFQEIENYIAFYPNSYFCPKSYVTGQIELTENTYCIHHFARSGVPKWSRYRNQLKLWMICVLGYERFKIIFPFLLKK